VNDAHADQKPAATVNAEGGVKWFDPIKGFGFILIDSCANSDFIGRDALLHISVLRRKECPTPNEGDRVAVTLGRGERGLQVLELKELSQIVRPIPDDIDSFVDVEVRWFNRSKGYGFIAVKGSGEEGEDVFLHIATLRRAGIESVEDGQKLRARVESGPKGTIATAVYI
jgi:cold shock protein